MINQKKILLADDDSDFRAFVAKVLEKKNFDLVEVDSGQNVLEIVSQESPDLILMDANLPEEDGWSLTMKIREMGEFKNTPIISLTAYRGEATAEACGSTEYIPKPIEANYLIERIESYFKVAKGA
jgi:CheY-like chemotaxis protein